MESAVKAIDTTIIKNLLDKGASIDIQDKHKKSPLDYAKGNPTLADLFRNSSLGM